MGYVRGQRAYAEMRNAAIELGAGYQAIANLQTHFRNCPQGGEVFTQIASDIWHLNDECDDVYTSGHEIPVPRPSAICNRQNLREDDVDADPVRHF